VGTVLNGFEIRFSAPKFDAYVSELQDPEGLRALRERERGEWFFYWREGTLYGIPEIASPQRQHGKPLSLDLSDHHHLSLLASRINDRLPSKFPQYDALRTRPFEFLGKRDELVATAATKLRTQHPLLSRFKIRPRFELDARLYELRDGETRVGLFVSVSTKWEIAASLSELAGAGIELRGLYAVRRNPATDERRLAGRIEKLSDGRVYLSESFDHAGQIAEDDVWLEGSRMSFKRCLAVLLRGEYGSFDRRRGDAEGELLGGPGIEQLCAKMGEVLAKNSPIAIGPGIDCSVHGRIAPQNVDNYKTVVDIGQGEYCFDPAKKKRARYAWAGIEKFGPFSRDTFSKRSPRILVLSPDKASGKVGQFVGHLSQGITSVSNSHFAGGFSKLFHLHNPEFHTVTIPMLGTTPSNACGRYRETIESALRQFPDYDAALVAILDEHSELDHEVNPYTHAKALLLAAGVPVQQFRMATATQSAANQQYILQNIALSLYAKMGGVPWTVDQGLSVDDEIVIGMGTAEMSGSRFNARQRYVGITTVFRGDGNYLLGHLSRDCTYDDYPDVLADNTTRVLQEMRGRNGWRAGDTIRVVFHAHKPLKKVEVGEIVSKCVTAAGGGLNVQFAFVTVSHDHPFRVIDPEYGGIAARAGDSVKAKMVPPRGRVVQLGRYTRLLCTKGPSLIKRPQTPLPAPLLIGLHKSSTYRDLQYLSEQVLKFTNLSWRGTLPAEDPVTVYYSQLIAKELARLRDIEGWSPTILNTRLRHSMWFL
jgi:hypothetical protein